MYVVSKQLTGDFNTKVFLYMFLIIKFWCLFLALYKIHILLSSQCMRHVVVDLS